VRKADAASAGTPSCGAGTMEHADAERVFELNHALGEEMRRRYF